PRPIQTSASSGPMEKTSSLRSPSTTRTSRPASSANNGDNAGARSGPGAFFYSNASARVTDSKTDVPALELRNLSKNFGGVEATHDVLFHVMAGDRKAIIGPNGAGKTTLFNLITGIYPVSSGAVLLFGEDVTKWESHHRTAKGMARTFQITSL